MTGPLIVMAAAWVAFGVLLALHCWWHRPWRKRL